MALQNLWKERFDWPNFTICLILFYTIYFLWKTTYWTRLGLKGPFPIPILGTRWLSLIRPGFISEQYLLKKYGKVVGLYWGTDPAILIADPNIIKQIMVKEFSKFQNPYNLPYIPPEISKILFVTTGHEWKNLRSKLSSTISSGKLRKIFTVLKKCVINRDNYLKSTVHLDQGNLNLRAFWSRYLVDVATKSFFSIDIDAYNSMDNLKEEQHIVEHMKDVVSNNRFGVLITFLAPGWFAKLTKSSIFKRESIINLRKLVLEVIETRKKGENRGDFLEALLARGIREESEHESTLNKPYSNKLALTKDEIVSSSLGFLIGASHPLNSLLSWSCWHLALNQEIQERLHQEISQADTLTYENVKGLPYLEAVMCETLRICPPIPDIFRICNETYRIPKTRFIIPKGAKVMFPVYAIQHDPDLFEEPEVFKPERFMSDNQKKIMDYSFMPFGAGPRICLGQRFGMINAKLALASILLKYRFVPCEETILKPVLRGPHIGLDKIDLKVKIQSR